MGLGTFMGGMGAAANGFTDGARQQKADNMTDERNSLESMKIDAAKDMLPDQVQLAKDQTASASADLADKEELRPQVLDVTKAKSVFDLQSTIHKTALEAMEYPQKAAAVTDTVLGQIGAVAQSGDPAALGAAIEQAARTPLMPALNKVPPINSAAIVPATAGMTDVGGNPITSKAIELTHPDGTKSYLNAQSLVAPYQRYKAALDKAQSFTLKPGETKFAGDGRVIAEGNDRAYNGLVQDADGNWIDMRPRTSGAGAGAGKGGKVAPTPQSDAQNMLNDLFEKNGKDLPVEARSAANSYLPSIFRANPNLDPGTASRVALDAAVTTDPNKKNLQLDPMSGSVSLMYTNPEVDGGKPFMLAQGAGSTAALEKQLGGPAKVKAAVVDMLRNQPNPKVSDAIVKAAADPAAQADLEAAIAKSLPPEAQAVSIKALRQKIGLVKQYGVVTSSAAPAPAAAPAAGSPSAIRPAGGMSGYTPPEGSPAARFQAARAKAQEAANAKSAQAQEAAGKVSAQFQSDLKSMAPLELLQKYDPPNMRGQLSQPDLQALQAAQQKI